MSKLVLSKPVVIFLYGFPGSGKSYVARNLSESIEMANVNADRLRSELFEHPRYDSQENAIITHLMNYMTEEFLSSGVSVVYDASAARLTTRRNLRELARRHKAEHLLVWLQIDVESAYARTQNRDRRTSDDKYAEPQSRLSFDKQIAGMQHPKGEDYLVISGKHSFATQKSAIINRLYQASLINSGTMQSNVAKPGLVNLVPNLHGGRVDMTRRNITIG
ncbi:hypothetical protein COU91_02945 [Candidatus Saccharibacteria bacterium CG10_big_fil_rev_8_21_14_0_10_47_8]|nr:MAG: hypothetical protein COU91_02945 [Candidatus Saccharibacteria bacterium CG10_big_fil_rev_8_21_14_0_10_47_8]